MFSHNYNMHTFRANISKVTDGLYMFWGNSSLVTFEGSLESLEDGGNMFDGCILSINSVKNIADTIKTHTSGTHNITVGMGCTEAEYNAEGSEWNSNIQRIKDKGWTVACQYNKR